MAWIKNAKKNKVANNLARFKIEEETRARALTLFLSGARHRLQLQRLTHSSRKALNKQMTMSIHGSLHAVFRVGKPQYDLLRFDFQVGLWRDRRLPERRCRRRRRRLLLLPAVREPAPGEQPDGAERSAGDVQLPLRRRGRRQPELRQLLPLQHRPIRDLLLSGGLRIVLIWCSLCGGEGMWRGVRTDRSSGFCSSICLAPARCPIRQGVGSRVRSSLR